MGSVVLVLRLWKEMVTHAKRNPLFLFVNLQIPTRLMKTGKFWFLQYNHDSQVPSALESQTYIGCFNMSDYEKNTNYPPQSDLSRSWRFQSLSYGQVYQSTEDPYATS